MNTAYTSDIRIDRDNFSLKKERKLLRAIFISQLHVFFCKLFQKKFQPVLNNDFNLTMECYSMDTKIIQILIHEITETGEYTLEGIAAYTRIPLDVIIDAACGQNNQLSITPWARIVDLYLQVKPDVSKVFFDKIVEAKDKNKYSFSLLLSEAC